MATKCSPRMLYSKSQFMLAPTHALTKKQSKAILILILSSLIIFCTGCGGKGDSTPTTTTVPAMPNMMGLMGLSAEAADGILGKPYNIRLSSSQTDLPVLPTPLDGDWRDYDYSGYDISLLFDKQQQISKGVFVWGGLAAEEYTLDNASALLEKLGVHVTKPFDISTDWTVSWYNDNGFEIYMALGHKTGEHQYELGGTYIDRVYIRQLP